MMNHLAFVALLPLHGLDLRIEVALLLFIPLMVEMFVYATWEKEARRVSNADMLADVGCCICMCLLPFSVAISLHFNTT